MNSRHMRGGYSGQSVEPLTCHVCLASVRRTVYLYHARLFFQLSQLTHCHTIHTRSAYLRPRRARARSRWTMQRTALRTHALTVHCTSALAITHFGPPQLLPHFGLQGAPGIVQRVAATIGPRPQSLLESQPTTAGPLRHSGPRLPSPVDRRRIRAAHAQPGRAVEARPPPRHSRA